MFSVSHTRLSNCVINIPSKIGKYEVVKIIGKGGFAVVVLAKDQKTNKQVAIKIVSREELMKQNIMVYFENELRLSSRFNHPSIVSVYEVIYEKDAIMIVMEYLSNGDMHSILSKGIKFNYEEQIKVASQMLEGLRYLHQRGICHRDIKTENILFDENMNAKLIDFGLSKENSSALHTYCGTPFYMAPEVILFDTYDGKKADIWAFGVVMHIIATGHFPWAQKSEVQLIKELKSMSLDLYIEPAGTIGNVIKNSLVFDYNERASADDLLQIITKDINHKAGMSKISYQAKKNYDAILPKLTIRNSTSSFAKIRRYNENITLKY